MRKPDEDDVVGAIIFILIVLIGALFLVITR